MLYFHASHASIEKEFCFSQKNSILERMNRNWLQTQLFMKPKEGA